VIRPSFLALHDPCYWHYDVLFGLKVLGEAGLLGDPRCGEALDLLAAKRLPDAGFPAEARYYRPTRKLVPSQRSLVDWRGRHAPDDPRVTVDALSVLHTAGCAVGAAPPQPGTAGDGRAGAGSVRPPAGRDRSR
jgi:hypothetical protein